MFSFSNAGVNALSAGDAASAGGAGANPGDGDMGRIIDLMAKKQHDEDLINEILQVCVTRFKTNFENQSMTNIIGNSIDTI